MTPAEHLAQFLQRATRDQWRVYGYDTGDWMPLGSAVDSLVEAQLKQRNLARRYPVGEMCIVRETVNYQIEERQ